MLTRPLDVPLLKLSSISDQVRVAADPIQVADLSFLSNPVYLCWAVEAEFGLNAATAKLIAFQGIGRQVQRSSRISNSISPE